MTNGNIEGWTGKKKILVILAHPDDPDFFCGAMIARWCSLGHIVSYYLVTKGQRGSQDTTLTISEIEKIRIKEQKTSARMLGVKSVQFLEHMDGELVADLELREEIIRLIRRSKPDIVVTSDPQNLFHSNNRINHPDHRAAGQAVIDAVFPAAGNPRVFLEDENGILPPHQIDELWVTLTQQPNLSVDLTPLFEKKLEAILCHRSQIYDTPEEMREKMRPRFEPDPESGDLRYYEKFKRIIFQIK